MITAKEARALSDASYNEMRTKADEWAKNELEYIEGSILNATDEGRYETSYWWSASIFEEANIDLFNAAQSICELLFLAGYYCSYHISPEGDILKIIINWEEEERHIDE